MSDQPAGGTHIAGDANLEDGDFVGRDKVIQNIQNVNIDIEKVIAALQRSLPENDPTPQRLLDTLQKFQQYHVALHEWKELHNFLNDVLHEFGQFATQIAPLEWSNERPDSRLLLRRWRPISQTVNALLEWGKGIQYIGAPFLKSDQGLQGAAWAIDMYIAEENLERLLKTPDVDTNALLDAHSEFDEKAQTHMYLADKKLRETADELYNLSCVVLGNLGHE